MAAKKILRKRNKMVRPMLLAPISTAMEGAPQRLGTGEGSLTPEYGW
jgi:hypothetical protein